METLVLKLVFKTETGHGLMDESINEWMYE